MRRREFIAGALCAAPFINCGQATAATSRRIGVLMTGSETGLVGRQQAAAFVKGMSNHGWKSPGELNISWTWANGDADTLATNAAELAAAKVDVILAVGSLSVSAAMKITSSVPIIFVLANDPLEQGYTTSLSRPDKNVTGFMAYEYDIGPKWLDVLLEMAPLTQTVVGLYGPESLRGYERISEAIEAVAPNRGVRFLRGRIQNVDELTSVVSIPTSASRPGLLVYPSAITGTLRQQIIAICQEKRIPVLFGYPVEARSGGLAAYGIDSVEIFETASGYVSRCLAGEPVSSLPIQSAKTYKLVLNRRAAASYGLQFPDALLARADEVIE